MAVDKFKFVSPGVFIDEVDESAIPELPERMGPLVVGRFQKGPAHRPVQVNSFKDFVATFGNPADGNATGDVYRSGAQKAPTYAAYAAQAWLRNNSPCTVYRVLGQQHGDATTAGVAGWTTTKTPDTKLSAAGGAYGMFIFPSASFISQDVTGSLAAIWYFEDGAIALTGSDLGLVGKGLGAGTPILSTDGNFTAQVLVGDGTNTKGEAVNQLSAASLTDKIKFNFNRDSKDFVRRVFSTDPTRTNSAITYTAGNSYSTKKYWLGETYESATAVGGDSQMFVESTAKTGSSDKMFGIILQLNDSAASGIKWHNHNKNAQAAASGWFISQDTRGNTNAAFNPVVHTEKLFKIHALGGAKSAGGTDPGTGEAGNREIKVSLTDIKVSPNNFNDYATFSLLVRDVKDTDNNPIILERFSSLTLDPSSANYISKVIGDRSYRYNEDEKVVDFLGAYANNSKLIRVEVSPIVEAGGARSLVPFGVYGPIIPKDIVVPRGYRANAANEWVQGSGSAGLPTGSLAAGHIANSLIHTGSNNPSVEVGLTLRFPRTRVRVSSSEGSLVTPKRAFFGYQSNVPGTKRFEPTNVDLHRGKPAGLDQHANPGNFTQYSWVFSLDDVRRSGTSNTNAYYQSGSRAAGTSYTAQSAANSGSVVGVLNAGFNKFTSPLFGGFDGFDIKEADPLRNSLINGKTELNSYAFHSLKKAVDVIADPEYVEFDIATMPGVTNDSLNTQLVQVCEERADALAIIDLKGNFEPPHEHNSEPSATTKLGQVDGGSGVVDTLKGLNINSSYGASFYPFVQIRDTINDSILYVPPSVVALGTMSSSQRKSAVWFAPAGFTRGGLSEGSAGLPVIGVRERLTSEKRDKLYEANINPIASFPAEGIVVFGQKTLQLTPSALDRINVRRLLIFVKKEISRIASTLLFDQNVQNTWNRFRGQVEPFLGDVQAGLGLTDFRVVLDETTTTPDLVDRNVLYAKIFLRPARAIEFIALDFIISRSGASFDD
tara:strand:+ start:3365 stop:6361 length:2997 start_codon:yes stop_codon:yes gene_type:complete